jgi:hypothetical protein
MGNGKRAQTPLQTASGPGVIKKKPILSKLNLEENRVSFQKYQLLYRVPWLG